MSSIPVGCSPTLLDALASRYGIEAKNVIQIVEEVLGDLHRVAIQSEYGPIGAVYASKLSLSERIQYHLAGILIEYVEFNGLKETSEFATDVFRFVSPERDYWNEVLAQWYALRHPKRVALDEDRRSTYTDGDRSE
jgi:hypothetical protein